MSRSGIVYDNTGGVLDTAHRLNQTFILEQRVTLGAVAWAGFERAGRGVLVVDLESTIELEPGEQGSARHVVQYVPAGAIHETDIPADLVAKMARSLSAYDPSTGVVVLIARPGDVSYYRVRLTPTPPAAYVIAGDQVHEAEELTAFLGSTSGSTRDQEVRLMAVNVFLAFIFDPPYEEKVTWMNAVVEEAHQRGYEVRHWTFRDRFIICAALLNVDVDADTGTDLYRALQARGVEWDDLEAAETDEFERARVVSPGKEFLTDKSLPGWLCLKPIPKWTPTMPGA